MTSYRMPTPTLPERTRRGNRHGANVRTDRPLTVSRRRRGGGVGADAVDSVIGRIGAAARDGAGKRIIAANIRNAARPRRRLLSTPSAGVIAFDGWDTHANHGGAEGPLANRIAALDTAIKALQAGLGATWRDALVVIATEFGRTVSVNGTRGTDHGTGGVAFALGGAVKGGRFLGDWPGLSDAALYERRDVAPANDLRALFKGALAAHWGLDRAALGARVFPGIVGAPMFDDIAV